MLSCAPVHFQLGFLTTDDYNDDDNEEDADAINQVMGLMWRHDGK